MSGCKFKEGDKIRYKETGEETVVKSVYPSGTFDTKRLFNPGGHGYMNYFYPDDADLFELVEPAGPLTLGVGTGAIPLSAEDLKKHGIYAPAEEANAPPKYCCFSCAKHRNCDSNIKTDCGDGLCSKEATCPGGIFDRTGCWEPKEVKAKFANGSTIEGEATINPQVSPREIARRQREHGKRAEELSVRELFKERMEGSNENTV